MGGGCLTRHTIQGGVWSVSRLNPRGPILSSEAERKNASMPIVRWPSTLASARGQFEGLHLGMGASIQVSARTSSLSHATLLLPRTRGNTVKGQAERGAPRLSGRAGRSLSACEEARHLVGQCQRHPCLHLFATRIAKDQQRDPCSLTWPLWYLALTVPLLLLRSRATPRGAQSEI